MPRVKPHPQQRTSKNITERQILCPLSKKSAGKMSSTTGIASKNIATLYLNRRCLVFKNN